MSPSDPHQPQGVRLQKVLADAGLGSRRACEQLITAGKVTVNGQLVRELGTRVNPATAVIHVAGLRIQLDDTKKYVALNKPAGVISAMSDPHGRPTLADYVDQAITRLFHVGRLDADTEGLILLTNDGELANRLAHPSYEVPKTYLAQVKGPLSRDVGRRLRAGIQLEDGIAVADRFVIRDTTADRALVELELHDGRNRIVRRMLDAVGHPVQRLVRLQVGPIRLADLPPGQTRPIAGDELGKLLASVGL